MSSFEEDQATIAEALRRPKSRGNPWRSERGEAMLETGTDLKATPIKWHWNGWLARGKLHLLAGSKTTGKSTVSLNLMATATIGADWPDGTRAPIGDVLLWTGEDGSLRASTEANRQRQRYNAPFLSANPGAGVQNSLAERVRGDLVEAASASDMAHQKVSEWFTDPLISRLFGL